MKRVLGRWLPEPSVPAESAGTQPADVDLARSRYGAKHADELSRMFIVKTAVDLQDLKHSSLARDSHAVLRIAHGLAGVCATLFAHRMRATCSEILTAVGHPDWDRVQALARRLDDEFDSTREHLQRHLVDGCDS